MIMNCLSAEHGKKCNELTVGSVTCSDHVRQEVYKNQRYMIFSTPKSAHMSDREFTGRT